MNQSLRLSFLCLKGTSLSHSRSLGWHVRWGRGAGRGRPLSYCQPRVGQAPCSGSNRMSSDPPGLFRHPSQTPSEVQSGGSLIPTSRTHFLHQLFQCFCQPPSGTRRALSLLHTGHSSQEHSNPPQTPPVIKLQFHPGPPSGALLSFSCHGKQDVSSSILRIHLSGSHSLSPTLYLNLTPGRMMGKSKDVSECTPSLPGTRAPSFCLSGVAGPFLYLFTLYLNSMLRPPNFAHHNVKHCFVNE